MFDVTEATKILEKHFAKFDIEFSKSEKDHIIEYVFRFEHIDQKKYTIKVDVDQRIGVVTIYVVLYKNINHKKALKILEYVAIVNNLINLGCIVYESDNRRFLYRLATMIFHAEDLVEIVRNGIGCMFHIIDVFVPVFHRLTTKSVDIRAACALTANLLKNPPDIHRYPDVKDDQSDI
jgi:hypothetical protein